MPKGKGYNDYDSAGKKKSIAKRLGKAAIEVAANPMGYSKMMSDANIAKSKSKPQSKRRPGEAPSTIAGRTGRTAPVKKSTKGNSAASKKRLPRQATSGGGSGLADRSPAMSPKKKGDAGKGVAQKKAASKASVDKVDAGRRRTQVAVKRGAAKKAATRSAAMASGKKRDRAASRNRRYKDDRAYRD